MSPVFRRRNGSPNMRAEAAIAGLAAATSLHEAMAMGGYPRAVA